MPEQLHIKRLKCPFTHDEIAAVKVIDPDVGIIHVQRADKYGNTQKWGSLGMDRMGINASKKITVTAEKIVDPEVIRRDPRRTMVPGVRVHAVAGEPWGAYPAHLAGCYDSDFDNYLGAIEGGRGQISPCRQILLVGMIPKWRSRLKVDLQNNL